MKSSFVVCLPAVALAKEGRSYFVSVSRSASHVVRHPEGVKRPKDPVGAVCKRDSSSAAGGLRMTPLFCSLAMIFLLLAACGGEKSSIDDSFISESTNTNLSETQKDLAPKSADEFWKSIIYSKHYSGELLVTFTKDSNIRLRFSKFVSMSGKDTDQINHYIQQRGAKVSRSLAQLSESQIESAVKSSTSRGKNFTDWNLIYRIKIKNPDYAYELMNILKSLELVEDIQPMPILSVSDAGITPDIEGDQDYLKSNAQSGGLNVEAAWGKSTGEGVTIMDSEPNWNFNHEDLGISEADVVYTPPGGLDEIYYDNSYIQHGTAVIGVVRGLDNELGVKGISYNSVVKVAHTDCLIGGPMATMVAQLENYNSGNSNSSTLIEGDIILLEGGVTGPTTGDKTCDMLFSGCLLVEAYGSGFDIVSKTTNAGLIVIEGAANGVANLDDPIHHIDGGPDLTNFVSGSENDSGAIVVGASTGGSHEKALWSNCGSRVNVYAWGYDVTTAGYGDHAASDPADQNKWYTANFSGTSSAAAIIAGAAAVIQSYARELYGHNPPYKNVYLDSHQMRDLLIASGQNTPFLPGTDPQDPHPNCNIGVQPDVNYALQLLDEGYVIPNIKFVSAESVVKYCKAHPTECSIEDACATSPVACTVELYCTLNSDECAESQSTTKLDIDGDARGDLIIYAGDKWYIDLSSEGNGGDNFGAWDLEIEMTDGNDYYESHLDPPNIPYSQVQPVVADYNSDGLADLALYGITNGVWYISYTDNDPIDNGVWHGWDRIINYGSDPNWKWYSRPVHGDYDGDGWMDLALQTPDGYWLIDYGDHDVKFPLKGDVNDHGVVNPDYMGTPYIKDDWGAFVDYADDPATPDVDETRKGVVKYLTDEQLAAAPGWAYLPFIRTILKNAHMFYKNPDGVDGILSGLYYEAAYPLFDAFSEHIYEVNLGGNDWIPVPAKYTSVENISVKANGSGSWKIANWSQGDETWMNLSVDGVFGGVNCRPIPADYDGDKKDDRAVFCVDTNEWIIAYSGDDFANQMSDGYRTIVTPDIDLETVEPGQIYPGGTSYTQIKDTFDNLGVDIQNLVPPILPKFNICFYNYLNNSGIDLEECFE